MKDEKQKWKRKIKKEHRMKTERSNKNQNKIMKNKK